MNVLWNGQVIDSSEAVISVFDHGFLYGMGLFETFRTYGGQPWLLERHAARLAQGCRMLGILYEPDVSRLREDIARLLKANGLDDAYIRWSVSAGQGAVGLPAGLYETPTEIVYAKELPVEPHSLTGEALRLLRLRRSSPEGSGRLKSFHYMNNIVAKRELTTGDGPNRTEGLFLDSDGHVCEGIVSNVFWMSGDVLYTPSIHTGALPGITRAFVLDLASSAGWRVAEGFYRWDDLVSADEVFLTGSVQEVTAVTSLEDEDGRLVRRLDAVGPRTRELMRRYRTCTERGESGESYLL